MTTGAEDDQENETEDRRGRIALEALREQATVADPARRHEVQAASVDDRKPRTSFNIGRSVKRGAFRSLSA